MTVLARFPDLLLFPDRDFLLYFTRFPCAVQCSVRQKCLPMAKHFEPGPNILSRLMINYMFWIKHNRQVGPGGRRHKMLGTLPLLYLIHLSSIYYIDDRCIKSGQGLSSFDNFQSFEGKC